MRCSNKRGHLRFFPEKEGMDHNDEMAAYLKEGKKVYDLWMKEMQPRMKTIAEQGCGQENTVHPHSS